MHVDHVGIAVQRLNDSVRLWEATLGVAASPAEEVTGQKVRVSFLEAGTAHVELLEATDPASPIARFLEERGEGLHHVAFQVPNVDEALAAVARRGGRVVDRSGRPGARGRRIGFAHPSAHHGVLVEFVEVR